MNSQVFGPYMLVTSPDRTEWLVIVRFDDEDPEAWADLLARNRHFAKSERTDEVALGPFSVEHYIA